jgi:hypothetical protein
VAFLIGVISHRPLSGSPSRDAKQVAESKRGSARLLRQLPQRNDHREGGQGGRYPVIVAKLDRLSRDFHFVSPKNPRFSNSVSSRSVFVRRCSRDTATLEAWIFRDDARCCTASTIFRTNSKLRSGSPP